MTTFFNYYGNKRRLLPALLRLIPPLNRDAGWIEPFVGSGSVLLSVRPRKALIGDANFYLTWCYRYHQRILPYQALKTLLATLATKYCVEKDYTALKRTQAAFNRMPLGLAKVGLFYLIQALASFPVKITLNGTLKPFCFSFDKKKPLAELVTKIANIIYEIKTFCQQKTVLVWDDQRRGNIFTKAKIAPDDFVFLDPPYGLIGEPTIKDIVYIANNNYHGKQTFAFCQRLASQKGRFLHTNNHAVAAVYRHHFPILALPKVNNSLSILIGKGDAINDYAIYNYPLPKEKQQRLLI